MNGDTISRVTETNAATGRSFSAGNYIISYATGQLTVVPSVPTVTADHILKYYAGSAFSCGSVSCPWA